MTTILFGRESACTEDPGGHDRRTTLVPADVRAYLAAGFEVVVQAGLGEGIGYLDNQYEMEGARVEAGPDCFADKELVVKLKGASAQEIARMSPGTVMLTMAHLYCFPERERQLAERGVRVIAMEGVRRTPEPSSAYLAGIRAGAAVPVDALGPRPSVHVLDSADQDFLNGLVRALMRRAGRPLHVDYREPEPGTASQATAHLTAGGDGLLGPRAADGGAITLESGAAAGAAADALVEQEMNRSTRAVGQTRQVGIGATRYGVGLYQKLHGAAPGTVVLGYGNVSMGSFEQLRHVGIEFTVLGRGQTARGELPGWLAGAGLIINGAETPGSTDYIITNKNVEEDVRRGAVVVDLIGGSPYRRSPVELFEWTTFLPEIHFEKDGRYFAGLWAWDMYYSMHDTTVNYSRMIKELMAADGRYAAVPEQFVADHAYAQQLGA